MDEDQHLRLPKTRMSALLMLTASPPRKVELFLSESVLLRKGMQKPSELLNQPEPFFAAADEHDRVLLVRRASVLAVTVPARIEFGPRETGSRDADKTSVDIEVLLENGNMLRGQTEFVMPRTMGRLQDFLNLTEEFFVVRDGPDAHIVNLNHVVWVAEVEKDRSDRSRTD